MRRRWSGRSTLADSKLISPQTERKETNVDRTITCEVRGPGIAFLTFDRPGSAANIFDQATFEQLNNLLDQVENDSSVRGLVIASAKPKIFIAGADLTGFSKDPSPENLAKAVDQGQRTFERIAN